MSTLIRWNRRDPFAELNSFYRAAFGPTAPASRPSGFTPAAEVVREGRDALVRLEVPGIDAERDLSVEVTGNRLVVRGERRDEREDSRDGRVLREVRYGSFRRSFTLPEHVGDGDITATYDQGVLTVRVAGAYTRPEARRIEVTGSAPAVEPAAETAETAEETKAA